MLNVAADGALVAALLFAYTWEPSQPLRTLPYLVVLEAALCFRLRGGVFVAALTVPLVAAVEGHGPRALSRAVVRGGARWFAHRRIPAG